MANFESPVRLRLDSDALVSNWRTLAKMSQSASTGAAVKAGGYGLGAREVVQRLSQAGCRDFFVAHWAEAAVIADIVPPSQISVLNGITSSDIAPAIDLGAVPVLNTPDQIANWRAAGGGLCHVMIDSGINRMGLGPEQISTDLLRDLDIDILMSHLASADEDVPQNGRQLGIFRDAASSIKARRRSLANSAGITLGRDYHFDLTRPGIGLYGGIARSELQHSIRQVAFPSARVLQMRQLRTGDRVGYNATFICPHDMKVATLSIGYADGYLRAFSSVGHVVVNGLKLPVIGRVSMDLLLVDASLAADLHEGDWVDIDYDLSCASQLTGLSQYELLTGLGNRFDLYWS